MTSYGEYQRQLNWRIKQIQIGKQSEVYAAYIVDTGSRKRKREDPATPDAYDARMSKRQFEGRVKAWKRALHCYNMNKQNVSAEKVNDTVHTVTFFVEPSDRSALIGGLSTDDVWQTFTSNWKSLEFRDSDWTNRHRFSGIPP